MKPSRLFTVSIFLFSIFIFSCTGTIGGNSNSNKNNQQNAETSKEDKPINTEESSVEKKISQYFWGTWQRMDNGQFYIIDETTVSQGNTKYNFVSSDDTNLTVTSLGNFSKQSDSVMINGAIPYFRKGGTNLEYKMKLVGFEDTISRAASSLSGLKAKGKSKKYTSFSSNSDSEDDGTITLNAPVAGDVQTVTITSGDSIVAVVSELTVENNGSNMGTIPISSAGQYSLKVTGTIPDSEKDDGYLYGNRFKSYPMTLTITNVSDVASAPSVCTIAAENSCITVTSSDGNDISSGVIISTLKSGFTKTISLAVTCGNLEEAFIDTGLIITIKNAATQQTWQDFVPLRFFKGLVPVTVAAESTEDNSDAALNGFIIYPDGNSQFFTVSNKNNQTVYVPSFGNDNPYTIAFSGATIEGELSNSTEMLYTVASGTWTKKDIDKNSNSFIKAVQYGEAGNGNGTEDSATLTEQEFEAYLADGKVDFYKIEVNTQSTVFPNHDNYYDITYINEYGSAPTTYRVKIGTALSASHLPLITRYGYDFSGWYIDNRKIEEGYILTDNITLTAKWYAKSFDIIYNLDGGNNNSSNPSSYKYSDNLNDKITLNNPVKDGYVFEGWYENSDFSGEVISEISRNQIKSIKLYAKWELVRFVVTAETIPALDLSRSKYDVTVVVTGNITDSAFDLLANKIESAVITVSLDLSGTTGVSEIKGIVTPRTDYPNLNNYNSIFENCTYLKSVILPDCLETLGDYAFYNCKNLEVVILPEHLSSIGKSAFCYCSKLKSISIPDHVTSIGTSAFYRCSSLNSVSIGSAVVMIENMAFYGCTSLENITIPSSVSKIGTNVFKYCENLQIIYFDDTNNWYYGSYYGKEGTRISVASPRTNVTYFTSTYNDKYWFKE